MSILNYIGHYFELKDNDINFDFPCYRKYIPNDVAPIYLDKSSITTASSIQKKKSPEKIISKHSENISPDKSVSISSSLNSVQQAKPRKVYPSSSFSSHSAKKTKRVLSEP